jgi:S-adenosylmethionine hydrolase
MPRRIVTFTTDFGLSDHYAGVMKGVVLGIAPDVRIVDITHEIHAFEPMEAGFVIAQAYPYFPKRTIHVVVIDPGVGTTRRPILVEAAGQYFIGPDNGVFSFLYLREKKKVRAITAEKYFLHPVSATFHGRDVFSPVAAYLALGTAAARFGKIIDDYARTDLLHPTRTARRAWTGSVMKVDRFGNLITNFHHDEFPDLRLRPFSMAIGPRTIERIATTFAAMEPGEPYLVIGSSGYYEVAVNQASAAKLLGCGLGSPAELTIF